MLKRSLPALCAFLLLTACGGPEFDVRAEEPEGATWFPQVVESGQDAGQGLSITADADGNPHLAYLELPGTAEEQDAAATDPLATKVPAVGHAHWVQEIWTHSEFAQSDEDKPLDLTLEDETAIAVDAEGTHHVAWTEGGKLLYSTDPSGESPREVVDSVDVAGLSIWADEAGTPWIAYYEVQPDPEGPSALVRVATLERTGWIIETAAEADGSEPFGTGVGPGPDGPVVAYGADSGTHVASRQGTLWRSETVDPEGGTGVSMDLDAEGNPHLAYLTAEGQVRHAHSIGGGPWEIDDVGAAVALATTSIAIDDEGVHHIAWQRDVDLAYATNAGGEFAEAPLPASTAGGQRPRLAAGADVFLAWYSPAGTRLSMATFSEEPPLLAVPSPSAPPGGGTTVTACDPEGTELAIAAPTGATTAGFDKDCLAVEAGAPFSITFENQDAAVHNFAAYSADPLSDPAAEHLAGSEPNEAVEGGASATYDEEPIEEAGDFFFRCDFHPTTMTGTFVVAGK